MNQTYKLSPIYHWHERHGAQFILWSGWRQVDSYGDPGKEAAEASSCVGLCDLTPLTKIDVQGKECDALLSRCLSIGLSLPLGFHVCTHNFRDEGKSIRAVHLTRDRYLVLGPPAVRDELCEHLTLAASALGCVHVTDVTSGMAVLRILGCKSIDVVKKLCSVMLTGNDFADGRCMQAPIARVNAIVLRNDVSGLVSFDAFVSRDYAEYLWKAFIKAGAPYRISCFGLAACRRLSGEDIQRVAVI